MLGKLLKYEIKATSRIFLPIYLVLIIFAIINRFMGFDSDTFRTSQGITLTIYIIILVGMFVTSFIVMIQRFQKSLLSEEGYLMFTLPVNSWMHILSKLLITSMWIILSSIVAFISIMIITMQGITLSEFFNGLARTWSEMYRVLGASLYHLIIQIVVGSIVGMFSGIMLIYVSISIGHLSNNHKSLASVGAFLVVYTLTSILSTLVFGDRLTDLFLLRMVDSPSFPFGYVWATIGFSTLFMTINFVITNLIMTKRLNLE